MGLFVCCLFVVCLLFVCCLFVVCLFVVCLLFVCCWLLLVVCLLVFERAGSVCKCYVLLPHVYLVDCAVPLVHFVKAVSLEKRTPSLPSLAFPCLPFHFYVSVLPCLLIVISNQTKTLEGPLTVFGSTKLFITLS